MEFWRGVRGVGGVVAGFGFGACLWEVCGSVLGNPLYAVVIVPMFFHWLNRRMGDVRADD